MGFFAIRSGVTIDAPPSRVWSVLLDFPRYPEWNPFIRAISGEVREGARLEVRMVPPGRYGRRLRPRVLKVEPQRELRWRGHVLVGGLLDGEHAFRIEPEGAGCRFRQDETFKGLLLAFYGEEHRAAIRAGFETMNAALKRQAEL